MLMAAFVAAICVFSGLTLPPRRVTLAPSADGTVPGVLHIHTTRSDGRSASALSVRSQVNSGSVRPKWPNAAVFL